MAAVAAVAAAGMVAEVTAGWAAAASAEVSGAVVAGMDRLRGLPSFHCTHLRSPKVVKQVLNFSDKKVFESFGGKRTQC